MAYPHPSPNNEYGRFEENCTAFTKINAYLKEHKIHLIEWQKVVERPEIPSSVIHGLMPQGLNAYFVRLNQIILPNIVGLINVIFPGEESVLYFMQSS